MNLEGDNGVNPREIMKSEGEKSLISEGKASFSTHGKKRKRGKRAIKVSFIIQRSANNEIHSNFKRLTLPF